MYLLGDVETGGLDPTKTSLLTASFVLVSDGLKPVDHLNIVIKHDIYHVQSQALAINKINLANHDYSACTVQEAEDTLNVTLSSWYEQNGGALSPIGQYWQFDDNFLRTSLPDVRWNVFLSRDILDTKYIASFLIRCGLMPKMSTSLGKLADYYGIVHEQDHTAHGDCETTLQVLRAMIKKVRALVPEGCHV